MAGLRFPVRSPFREWFYLSFSAMMLICVARYQRRGLWIALAVFLALPLIDRFTVPLDAGWDLSPRKIVWLRCDRLWGCCWPACSLTTKAWQTLETRALCRRAGLIALLVAIWFLTILSWDIHGYFWRILIFNVTSVAFALPIPAALRIRIESPLLASAITRLSKLFYGLYLVHLNLLVLTWPWLDSGTWRARQLLGNLAVLPVHRKPDPETATAAARPACRRRSRIGHTLLRYPADRAESVTFPLS